MGTDSGEPFEGPPHRVRQSSFYIDQHEVTNRQYALFADATGFVTESERLGSSGVFDPRQNGWTKGDGADWRHPHGPGSSQTGMPDHPVVHLSWEDAKSYCDWKGTRLPTEAEFECAARGGLEGARYAWGEELIPGGVQIVDSYHAAEALWGVAKELPRDDRAAAETWAEARCSELRKGRLDTLPATLKAHAGHCTKAAECEAYIETNRERMRYADFRAQGLQIGSGVVEAGCKTVVAVRLKRAGMHWTKEGADGILALRACILGGRYEDSWAWRSESQHAPAA